MPDASNQTYSPAQLGDWTTDPRETDAALDELASRAQGGLFDAYDGSGAQTINGSASTVNIDTTRTNTDTGLFALAADVLTVTLQGGGTIDLSYRATLGTAGSGDYQFDLYVEHAPASTGVFAEVAGSRVSGGKGT